MRKGLELFLKYAFPCSAQSLSQGWITVRERKLLLEMARGEREIDLPLVERAFVPASKRIKRALRKKKLVDLSVTDVRRFFPGAHNKRVSRLPFPSAVREWCRASKARVISTGKKRMRVKLDGKTISVSNEWVKAKPGDLVAVHRNYAVEKLG